jgi:hypothetical protein
MEIKDYFLMQIFIDRIIMGYSNEDVHLTDINLLNYKLDQIMSLININDRFSNIKRAIV